MASLEQLLEGDGFRRGPKKATSNKKSKSLNYNICKDMNPMRQIRSVPPPGQLGKAGRESLSRPHRSSSRSSETPESSSKTRTRYNSESDTKSNNPTTLEKKKSLDPTTLKKKSFDPTTPELNKEAALDEAAVKAVISMIGGFCKRFIVDKDLRESLHKKCSSSLQEHKKPQPLKYHAEQVIVANLDWGMDGVESAIAKAADGVNISDGVAESLRNSTRMLSVAASLDVDGLRDSSTCGLKNSCLAACAYFYLAISYKLLKNDRLAAIHVLQVFCVSPSEGRLNFCNEIWDNLFLPHLRHLKVWYNEQYDLIDGAYNKDQHSPERSRKLKKLRKMYNKQVDEGTRQFAMYYKEWLMIGVKARGTPEIKPPSKLLKQVDEELDFAVLSEKQMASLPQVPLRRSL